MANGIGLFLPSEAAYSKPGTYEDALRAEAQKQAAYLSSMDQYYAELEESTRQFNETMAWSQESFKLAADAKRWETEETLKMQSRDIEQRRDASEMQYELGVKDIASKERISGDQVDAQKYGYDRQAEASKYNMDRQIDQREREAASNAEIQSRQLDQGDAAARFNRERFDYEKGVAADALSYKKSEDAEATSYFKEMIEANEARRSKQDKEM